MELLPTPELPINSNLIILSLNHASLTRIDCPRSHDSLQAMHQSEITHRSRTIPQNPHELEAVELSHSSFASKHQSSSQQKSMIITFLPNMDEECRLSMEMREGYRDSFAEEVECQELVEDKQLCINPLCLSKIRIVTPEDPHQDHQKVSLASLLNDLYVVKSNSYFVKANPQRVEKIVSNLNQVVQEIQAFESEFLKTCKELKIKTMKHIKEVKDSFCSDRFQRLRKKLRSDFSYATVVNTLGEIQRYKKLKYANLDYPHFKSSMLVERIKEINFNHKVLCLQHLKEWIRYLQGDHTHAGKVYNRSAYTFMYKSPSEKKMFSYYLKSLDYLVSDYGHKLQRIDHSQELPLAVVEKEVDESGIKFRVNRLGPKGISIGCGVLAEIDKRNFDNAYATGYYLHNTGVLFSTEIQTSNTFRFAKGDVISLHRKQHQIQFYKQQGQGWKGFHRNLHAYANRDKLNVDEHFYAAVFLGDPESEVQILPD